MSRIGKRLGRQAIAAAATLAAGLGMPALGQAQELSEIVVTARRVEEKLKDVPVSVTAFDAKTIEAAGITSLGDVANLTPGLSFFNAFGENLPVPVIRGVVPQDIFGENATAIFVDGVYVSGRAGLNFSQLDVQQIEVLKGPQSAQYGRNAFSGAINYITKPPSDVFEARTEGELGNRGKQKVLGVISGPLLGEMLTGRLSAMYDEWDGSYDNTLAPENDIGGYRYRSLQGKLRWRPLDSLDVNLGVYSSNDEIDDPATGGLPANCEDRVELTSANASEQPFVRYQNYCGRVPGLAGLPDALDGSQFPNMVLLPNSVTRDSMQKIPEALGEDRDLLRSNLNVIWDTDYGTLGFLTGYSKTEQKSKSDFGRSSGNTIPLAYCIGFTTTAPPECTDPTNWSRAPMGFVNIEGGTVTEEWSQEVRFTSPRDERLRYAAGVYYFNVDQTDRAGAPVATTQLPASQFDIGIGPVAYPAALAIGSYIFGPSLTADGGLDPLNRQRLTTKTNAWSVFGSMDFDLTDSWLVSGELRYSEESQDLASYVYKRCSQPNPNDATFDPENRVNLFPFNNPPVADCGDDYFDLRVMESCIPTPVDDRTRVDENGNFTDTTGDGIIHPWNDGACTPGRYSGSTDFQTVTGKISLKYKFETGWMAYGSIARGEKPGGLRLLTPNVLSPAGGVVPEAIENPFDPEKITTYELGLKGTTADRRLGLDFAVFYSDWTDIVLRQLRETSPVTGRSFEQVVGFNVNAGDAELWGWEATAEMAFTEGLTGRFTVGYTDSTLTNARQDTLSLFPSFYTTEPSCTPSAIQSLVDPDPVTSANEAQVQKAGECRGLSGDVSGNTQMRQPPWTSSASLTYKHALANQWDWFTRADANYLGKIYVGNDNQSYLPSRTNVNLRIGAESPRYSVEFWVRNLFSNSNPIAAFRDIYWTNDADIQGRENPESIRFASNFDDFPPFRLSVTYPSLRTFGLTGKIRFGGAER